MRYSGKQAILLLFINVLQVYGRTVLKTQIINETDNLLSLKANELEDCNCHETQECYLKDDGTAGCRCAETEIEKVDEDGVKTCLDCNCHETQECYLKDDGTARCRCAKTKIEKVDEDGVKTCLECYCGIHGKCHFENGKKVCTCSLSTVEVDGECVECNCGPYGSCSFENGIKKCHCESLAVEKNGVCVVKESTTVEDTTTTRTTALPSTTHQSCDCGIGGTCRMDSSGEKTCNCFPGYALYEENCFECNCGPYGSCSFEYGKKRCSCPSFAVEKNGMCVVMEYTTLADTTTARTTVLTSTEKYCNCGGYSKSCSFNCKGEKTCDCFLGYVDFYGICTECNCGPQGKCFFEGGIKRCICDSHTSEKNGKCEECNCGEYSKSCGYNENGKKVCDCFPGYVEKNGGCKECNCGPYGSCSFKYGQKRCHCRASAVEINGVCIHNGTSKLTTDSTTVASTTVKETCSDDICIHGKCEIFGNGFKCRCDEGFTGQRCEEKIQIKSCMQDLWLVLLLSTVFAIFILLSGMFCFWTHILNKMSKK